MKKELEKKWKEMQESSFSEEDLVEDVAFFRSTYNDIPFEFILGKPHQCENPETKKEDVFFRMYAADIKDKDTLHNIGYIKFKLSDIEKDEKYGKGLPIDDDEKMKQGKMHFYKKIGDDNFDVDFVMKHLDAAKTGGLYDKEVDNKEEYSGNTDIFKGNEHAEMMGGGSKDEQDEQDEDEDEDEQEEDKLFHISKNKLKRPEEKGKPPKKRQHVDDIFEEHPEEKQDLPPLPEETEESQKQIAQDYKEETRNHKSKYPWIVHLTKNTQYSIHPCNDIKNSYLEAVIAAFKDKGLVTTVEKLRNFLATEVSKTVFDSDKKLYESFEYAKQKIIQDKKIVTERMAFLAKYVKRPTEPTNPIIGTEENKDNIRSESEKEYTTLAERLTELKQDMQEIEHNIHRLVPHMANIKTMEQYRDAIRQSAIDIHDWAILILERRLHYKTVLFFEDNYSQTHVKQNDMVVNLVEPEEKEEQTEKPKYYIAMNYKPQGKYDLIRYRGRALLSFVEMPYGLKARLVTRSIEKPSSVVNRISDFIQFKHKSGLDEEEGDEDENNEGINSQNLFADKNVVLVIYSAAHQCRIGTTPCNDLEKVPRNRLVDFLALNRGAKDWRRRLSDDWMGAAFQLDDHKWDSVTHYLEAAPYKEDDPTFYAKFTKGNRLSEKPTAAFVEMAKKAGSSKSGTIKDPNGQVVKLRTGPLRKITEAEKERLRREAIQAKVMQNADIRRILENTRDATLKVFERGERLHNDNQLMQLRTEIIQKFV